MLFMVTVQNVGRVWVVGCLDGTDRPFTTECEAWSFAAREMEMRAMEAGGFFDGEVADA